MPGDVGAKAAIQAAKHGDCDALAALIGEHAELLEARDADGSTPLHCASWKGHLAAVVVLLEHGADVHAVNANDHWGTTPLHAAAHANHRHVVRELLEHGADPHRADGNGATPLAHTEFHRATAAAKVLREFGAV
jgi:ankyrin repeat protein